MIREGTKTIRPKNCPNEIVPKLIPIKIYVIINCIYIPNTQLKLTLYATFVSHVII